jgi:hypothetical protein
MDRRRFLTTAGLTLGAATFFAPFARASSGAAMTLNGALALVPVTIGPEGPYQFLVDTGAEVCLIGPAIGVPRSIRPMVLTAAGQTREVAYRRWETSGVSRAVGVRIDGLLGANFFAPSAVQFDFVARRLGLQPTGPRPTDVQDLVFQNIPYVTAQVRIAGVVADGLFGLDTGLETGVKLFRSAMGERLGGIATVPGRTMAAEGPRATDMAAVKALRLAGLDIVDLYADLSGEPVPRAAPPGVLGMIGASAFANRVLTLDIPGRWWSLSPVIL